MDRWPQRENFKAKVKEVGEALGMTHQEISTSLGISLEYLRSLLYRKNTRPDWDLAVRMSQSWHCDVTEFIDNPGGEPPAGLDKKEFREGPEEDRVYLRAMGHDLAKLTPEQKRNAIEAWRAVVRGITGS
jgi:transcriptional regulator with XRE-family HTH domain